MRIKRVVRETGVKISPIDLNLRAGIVANEIPVLKCREEHSMNSQVRNIDPMVHSGDSPSTSSVEIIIVGTHCLC